ncbi:thiolase family protein [Propionivibrio dicarboxylicus]|uniref:Acetyl-CoA acetyltransferase n=1 Tax=Propionivibrio dicarboxylicus TaxID=83767 RepID=A0A1G8K1B4_9RHOO|nr:acetyl-CoA C-acetyltransferase [Propionivibrio dicarboxylicus]SDI37208.1 acetyl-CoA acetyltransferase [Propionivibrio dicarboxylicus]
MQDVVIVSAVRTAIGKMGGSLKGVQPEDLATLVIDEAVKRAGIDPARVDEVIFGQAKQSTDAPNLARVAALRANIPLEVPAYTVMRQCGSGLQAVNNGAEAIMCGRADVIVAGGTESMSNAPYYLRNARYGYDAGNGLLIDSNTESQPRSQPIETYGNLTMGMTAENLAERYGISREEQDRFALTSQERAAAAIRDGRFVDEIVPVLLPQRKGDPLRFEVDEFPRLSSLEQLAKLAPVFKKGGSVTAGNSSGRNDGAACLIVMSAAEAQRQGLSPIAVLRAHASAGVSPEVMGIGPAPALRKALKIAGLGVGDLGLIELNEAFAAQSLAVMKELDLVPQIVNVNGGAIALGHPLGCSGARILTTLLHEMKRRRVKYGAATLCIAGGQGIASVVELL